MAEGSRATIAIWAVAAVLAVVAGMRLFGGESQDVAPVRIDRADRSVRADGAGSSRRAGGDGAGASRGTDRPRGPDPREPGRAGAGRSADRGPRARRGGRVRRSRGRCARGASPPVDGDGP